MNKITQQIEENYLRISQKLESHFERIDFTKKAGYYTIHFTVFLDKIKIKAKDLKSILQVIYSQINDLSNKTTQSISSETLPYYLRELQKIEIQIDNQKEELKSLQKTMREYWF